MTRLLSALFFLILFCLTSRMASCQEVQWACRVTGCSESYTKTKWAPRQVLGFPDVYPNGSKVSAKSYIIGFSEKDNMESKGNTFISVEFCKPLKARQIAIIESYIPGAIIEVYIHDVQGNSSKVYTAEPQELNVKERILNIFFPLTGHEIKAVKIVANPSRVPGWNYIDAIGLSDLTDSIDAQYILKEAPSVQESDILVTGKVYNAKTNQPIEARLVFENSEGMTDTLSSNSSEDGHFKVQVRSGKEYVYAISAKGFLEKKENFEFIRTKDFAEIKHDFYLLPIERGQTLHLNNVVFEPGAASLKPSSYIELNKLIEFMNMNPSVHIEIEEHSSEQLDPKTLASLSKERVKVIRAYLLSKGINSKRIETKEYKGSKEVADTGTFSYSGNSIRPGRALEITILTP